MNKNFKVIQINGLSGLLLLGVVLTGLICGFILFPIWILMVGWNELIAETFRGPQINYLQASMLWAMCALSLFMALRHSVSFKVHKDSKMNDVEIREAVSKIEEQSEELEEDKEEVLK